ncbi:MAG TPA: glycoside hydrolase family 2 TIM barrel-domain containing protein [Terriglobia bacterium]|nr:glycoside hydrolase family 2 TIM barrel-domain containing protein [Terriglobia bacterium]
MKTCATLLLLVVISTALAADAHPQDAASEPIPIASLDGEWNFLADRSASLKVQDLSSAKDVRTIQVPGSWQSEFSDLRDFAGVGWYWRSVQVDQLQPAQAAILKFGAVDYRAVVYVNNQRVGSHDGGYLPFEFDVTSFIHPGENQIAVRVSDPGAKPDEVEGIKYAEIPHGKQNWYVQTSGLWQSVEIDIRPQVYLGVVHISAGADGSFTFTVHLVNAPSDASLAPTLSAEILGPDGKVAWKGPENVVTTRGVSMFSDKLSNPDIWSLSHPALYTLAIQTSSGEQQSYRFGFRTFETRDGKFYLNGKPVYLRGALDQAFYPDTIYTPPSLDYLKNEMRKAKALGLNLLRCHIKVPDPRYLEAADETGMLIWYEIPNWDNLTADSEARALDTLQGMVQRDWNHPSIVIVSIANESWGVKLDQAADREWLKQTYHKAKQVVPGWLVEDNSACCQNFHVSTDLADFHDYNSIPDHAADFDRFVADLATRPKWLFSQHEDAEPKGNEPLMLSEFGNWGLPFVPEEKPWWFSRDYHGRSITLPEGLEKRFKDYQYDTVFPDLHALLAATQRHEFNSLKYEIASLRSQPSIQGYVITELTDVMWESNGLMDIWRNPKSFAADLSAIQQDDALLIRPVKHNYFAGSKAEVEVYFSHYAHGDMDAPTVTWAVEGTSLKGSFTAPAAAIGSSGKVGTISFIVPPSTAPSRNVLDVQIAAGGEVIGKGSVKLYLYPSAMPTLPPPVSFHDPQGELRRLAGEMQRRDYFETDSAHAHPVIITPVFDDYVKNALESGSIVILLAGARENISPEVKIVPRSENSLDGNWISNFAWVRKSAPPFQKIGFDTLSGFEAGAATPEFVVGGIPPGEFQDVLAGEFYGWIHSNVGTLVQARYGKGKLLICTFSLNTPYGTDPYATALMDELVSYAASGFSPKFDITPHGGSLHKTGRKAGVAAH